MRRFAPYAACIIAMAPAAIHAQVEPSPAALAAAAKQTIPLLIQNGRRIVRFDVEVALTPEKQELGLMFRRSMPANHGMIFPMKPVRRASFWMKNTLIPLDLVFIRPDRTISSIAANATPLSHSTIDSTEPVAAVLELNGGAAARAHLGPGDRVRW